MGQLVRYDQARQALQVASRLDEVKDMANKSDKLAAYARQAKDTDLEMWSTEIKERAKRQIGELSLDLEKAPGLRTDQPLPSRGKRLKAAVGRG